MQAGKLRERIELQGFSTTRASNGERIRDWSTIATVWAEVRVSTEKSYTRESFEGNKTNSYVVYEFIIRGRTDVTQDMRVAFEGKVFDITGIVPVAELGREIRLICNYRPDIDSEY